MKKYYSSKIVITSLFVLLSIISCKDDPGKATLGSDYVEPKTHYSLIDTLTVNFSTVLLDTLDTAGTGCMLLGSYKDDITGSITMHSYCTLGIPSSYDILESDNFDSANMIIHYNNFSMGDTTASQTLNVYKLLDNIENTNDSPITQNTEINHTIEAIGSLTFNPRPHKDSLLIRLDNAVGIELIDCYLNNEETMTDSARFEKWFPGLAFTMHSSTANTIIGFKANSGDIKLVLYTSRINGEKYAIRHEFTMQDSVKQFNHIDRDFSVTLASLTEQKQELPASQSDNNAFLQGGSGLCLRIDLPSLEEVLQFPRGILVKAELELAPKPGTYNDMILPSTLYLYDADKNNRIGTLGGFASASLELDEQFHENTRYCFNVSTLLSNELSDSYINPENGLLIMLPSQAMATRLDRMIVDNNSRLNKLLIYYLLY